MPTTFDYRRENLRNYIDTNGGPTAVALKLGYSNGSFLVQMTGPKPIRQVSEATARAYETKLGLIPGSLDQPVEIDPSQEGITVAIKKRQARFRATSSEPRLARETATVTSAMSTKDVMDLVTMISDLCKERQLVVSSDKFASLIQLALLHPEPRNPGDLSRKDFVERILEFSK